MTELEKILNHRAELLAKKETIDNEQEAAYDSVIFVIQKENYAIQSIYVREVFQLTDFTFIPGLPPYYVGIINFRGTMLPIINLKILFGIKEVGLTEMNKVIVLENEGHRIGILADYIIGNLSIKLNNLKEAPLTLTGIGIDFLSGIMPDGLIFLNGDLFLNSQKLVIND